MIGLRLADLTGPVPEVSDGGLSWRPIARAGQTAADPGLPGLRRTFDLLLVTFVLEVEGRPLAAAV
jgi:hypothetical protein